MRRSRLTTPALTVAALAVASGCSAASGGSNNAGSSSSNSSSASVRQSISVHQSSSATSSSGGSSAVSQTSVEQRSTATSAAAAREHHPVDLGDLGRIALRCQAAGRLAIGVELPPGAAAATAQLSVGAARVEQRLVGGQHVWTAAVPATAASVHVRRGRHEATVDLAVRHTSAGCVVTGVNSTQRATP